jgi:hypothetical protein
MEALKYLYELRHITASGHETTDTDPGLATTKDAFEDSLGAGLGWRAKARETPRGRPSG